MAGRAQPGTACPPTSGLYADGILEIIRNLLTRIGEPGPGYRG
jgi:hypothetical protein